MTYIYISHYIPLAITQQNVKIQRILSLTILCLELSRSLMGSAMKRKNRTLLSLLWVKDLKLSHLVHWQMIAFKWLALNATSMRWIANRNCVNNSFSELCREQQMNFKNVLSPLSWHSYSSAAKETSSTNYAGYGNTYCPDALRIGQSMILCNNTLIQGGKGCVTWN